jgi:hypothetical protein
MPGIIEGYNYDIFISYRQKDNKHNTFINWCHNLNNHIS